MGGIQFCWRGVLGKNGTLMALANLQHCISNYSSWHIIGNVLYWHTFASIDETHELICSNK